MTDEPVIKFKGYKTVKASPRGLSPEFSSRITPETFKILAILDQVTLSQLDLKFDLEGGAADTRAYIQALPRDTRSDYAINLLVFGKLGSEETSGNSAMVGQLTTKLNEISRRNLKNTDLSFSTNSYKIPSARGGSGQEHTDLSYSLSKGFMNNKLSFSIGGSVGLYMEDATEAPHSSLIGNIEINYKISDKPAINLKGSRQNVYEGIIDGDVIETSAGIYYQKTYPRFNDFIKPKKKKVIK